MATATEFHGQQSIVIILVGKSGAGKTALGNTLLGLTGYDDLSPDSGQGTREITKRGIVSRICIIDTPGLKENVSEKMDQLKKLSGYINDHHKGKRVLLVYCIPVGPGSRFDDFNPITMRCLQDAYGKSIWEHCLVVFTMSNLALMQIKKQYTTRTGVEYRYSTYINNCASKLQQELRTLKVNDIYVSTIFQSNTMPKTILAIPAGLQPNDKELNILPHDFVSSPHSGTSSWKKIILDHVHVIRNSTSKPFQLNYQNRPRMEVAKDTAKWASIGALAGAALIGPVVGLVPKVTVGTWAVLGSVAGIGTEKIVKRVRKRFREVDQEELPPSRRSRVLAHATDLANRLLQ